MRRSRLRLRDYQSPFKEQRQGDSSEFLDIVVTERNRLVRLSIFTSITGIVLSLWARDPYLNVSLPFSGEEAGNFTAAHIVLVGHPFYCLLFLILCSQIFRYEKLLESLQVTFRAHFDWKGYSQKSSPRFERFATGLFEALRFFAVIGLPVVASFVLYTSHFGFYMCGTPQYLQKRGPYVCEREDLRERPPYLHSPAWELITLRKMVSNRGRTIKPAYLALRTLNRCSHFDSIGKGECKKRESQRQRILLRTPKLYQPINLAINSFFQLCAIVAFLAATIRYIRPHSRAQSPKREMDLDHKGDDFRSVY